MTTKKYNGSSLILLAIVVSIVSMVAYPNQAWAQICPADADCDGFPDSMDGSLIQLPGGTWKSLSTGKMDLFIIEEKDPNLSHIPDTWWGKISEAVSTGGLNINVIPITAEDAGPDRGIVYYNGADGTQTSQKAVKITEYLNTDVYWLGWCSQGTPNGYDGCEIYTQKIRSRILEICGARFGGIYCTSSTGLYGEELVSAYIKWAMIHEVGHSTTLGNTFSESIGYHYPPGKTATIMAQSVYYTDRSGKVTFYIPAKWSSESQQTVDLWQNVHQ